MISLVCVLLSIAAFLLGIFLFVFSDRKAMKRQHIEEHIADEYVNDLLQWEKDKNKNKERISLIPSNETAELEYEYSDDNWVTLDGITYTPDYARGNIQCVLRVPAAGINRGVYGGTFEDIYYNLDIWMVVAARPDYELGKTHYVIYGHNHTTQNLSFNNLKNVCIGDEFTLTCSRGVFVYQVANIYADWRESVAANITDNFDLPKENCYIITCGRGENRYKDLVIEGNMVDFSALNIYNRERRDVSWKQISYMKKSIRRICREFRPFACSMMLLWQNALKITANVRN